MKQLFIAAVMLVSAGAAAAPNVEVINTEVSVSVMGALKCVVMGGADTHKPLEKRLFTELRHADGRSILLIGGREKEIELSHTTASGVGCNLTVVDQVVVDSSQAFGFAHDVPVEVAKERGRPHRNGQGECVADYREILKIELASGLVLTSEEEEVRASTECLK